MFFTLVTIAAIHAQISPQEAIAQMRKAINLGNTFEPPTEAGWNNPKAQEYYFDMYREAGFQCVRIPVRWDNHTGIVPPYTINKTWLDRIEQVVDWGLKRDLFIVINSHHDNWIKDNYSETNKARFDSIWTQISERFKTKSEKLIFEVLNEPHGLTKAQNDDMHARIISIIRKTNPTRLVIFQGHDWGGSDQLLTAAIPNDNYVIGSFHSYDPYLFGLQGEGTWGTAGDYDQLDRKFKAVYNWSVANNIPVFLGEFGSLKTCEYNSRMRHYRAYVELSQKYGFTPVAWDDGGDFRIMERQQQTWNELKDILIYTSAKSPNPAVNVYQDSIIRIRWINYVLDNDSIIIQRKLSTDKKFIEIGSLKSDTTFYYDVKPPMEKIYQYRVIAHYNDSSGIFSQPVQLFFPKWEKRVRAPFYGTLQSIPGIIEAEDFDYGGEDLAYHDADDFNVTGDYRPNEAVDIYDRLGDGFHIGNVTPGEWYEYSVEVKTEGWYDVTTYIATYSGGGTFQISVDTLKSEILTVTTSLSALTTKPITTKMYLFPGNKIVRFTVISGPPFNIDKMVFDIKTSSPGVESDGSHVFTAWQNINGALTIKLNQNADAEIINVYNVSGSLIQSLIKSTGIIEIPVFKTPAGVYFIQVVANNKKYSQKIMIQPSK